MLEVRYAKSYELAKRAALAETSVNQRQCVFATKISCQMMIDAGCHFELVFMSLCT